jgi:hypothetical protein
VHDTKPKEIQEARTRAGMRQKHEPQNSLLHIYERRVMNAAKRLLLADEL